jgi:hypothetical protein
VLANAKMRESSFKATAKGVEWMEFMLNPKSALENLLRFNSLQISCFLFFSAITAAMLSKNKKLIF